jgi:hypothetical protein
MKENNLNKMKSLFKNLDNLPKINVPYQPISDNKIINSKVINAQNYIGGDNNGNQSTIEKSSISALEKFGIIVGIIVGLFTIYYLAYES